MFEETVPDYLQELLAIEKKAELKRFCKKITITQDDLIRLIFNCSTIGYLHARKHHEFVPKHLPPKDNELRALGRATTGDTLTGDAEKCVNKISQIFKERRQLSAHVFYNDAKWHIFYFDLDDTDERSNHWKHGSHIHFVNYLWPNLDINNLFGLFDEAESNVAGKLHIRYKDQERTQGYIDEVSPQPH